MGGLYLHIPFCKQACYYCDFHFSTSLKKKEELIQALIKELELRKHELTNHTIETIYFGGGTPSLLTIDELKLLIDTVYNNYTVIKKPEITLEANPDDLSKSQIIQLSNSPINRLSIGIQSFFDDHLISLNRAHSSHEARNCLKEATEYFDNITIDLIYGIPKMSLQQWNYNLQEAFSFGINHISSYALTVEPKTALANFIKKRSYPPIDEELSLLHFNHLIAETEKHGFVQYEISNFGKPNYFSKHNASYWQGKRFLGIGPSAHSFNTSQRSWNIANNSKYIQSIQKQILPSTIETLTKNNQYNEYVMTGLRTIWGVSLHKIETDFGGGYKKHMLDSAQNYINQGLLELVGYEKDEDNSCVLKTTKKGKFLIDGIASDLFKI